VKKPAVLFVLFLAAALVQLAVPAAMIVRHEATLRHGRVFKFQTQPVDPYDAFRGRYVALRIEPGTVKEVAVPPWGYDERAYAELAEDTNGFTRVKRLSRERPAGPDAWVEVRVSCYVNPFARSAGGETARITWPFDRFYVQENVAPAAEKAYREHSRAGAQDAFVVVRVSDDGAAVIEDLWVGGKPLRDFLREANGR